ncbi:ROK family protein [Aquimarina agarilytica]|uniref:ROK family protein n=1 Tax=Aquimarina agarilytica TaxID=1087449 RepID=UPI0002885E6D|nr:ROK family protein [Aquimarina agarilytica]
MKVVLGIDIGGTRTKLGLVCDEGRIHKEKSFSTKDHKDFDRYIDQLTQEGNTLIEKDEIYDVIGIGIGAPNASSKRGTIENAANLNWKGSLPIVKSLEKYFNVPIKLMNDASAAALGEKLFGGAKEMDDFISVTLGTGFGGGVFCNGQLVDGFDGFAGELGHIDMTIGDGRLTGLNIKGGLEAYVSVTGLRRTVSHMLCHYMNDSPLRAISYNDLTGEIISDEARKGDFIAQQVFEYTAEILGSALSNFVAFTQPKAIFMAGGLTKSSDLLLEPTKKYLEQNLLEVYRGKVKLLISPLIDKNPAILGAAALIWNE